MQMNNFVCEWYNSAGTDYALSLLNQDREPDRFVGMVVDEQTVEAAVDHDDTDARFEVRAGNGRVAALGTARRSARVD